MCCKCQSYVQTGVECIKDCVLKINETGIDQTVYIHAFWVMQKGSYLLTIFQNIASKTLLSTQCKVQPTE